MKKSPGWVRRARVGVGALAIVLAFFVMFSPYLGAVFLSFIIGVVLLILGIDHCSWNKRIKNRLMPIGDFSCWLSV